MLRLVYAEIRLEIRNAHIGTRWDLVSNITRYENISLDVICMSIIDGSHVVIVYIVSPLT